MTREELKVATNDELIDELDYCGYDSYYRDYRDDVVVEIKKRMKEPILDKIKTEIEQNAYPIVHGVNNHEKGMTLNGILQIIDKYKAGNEK